MFQIWVWNRLHHPGRHQQVEPIANPEPISELHQVVKVPTRLNPDRILDPIITTLKRFYCDPITKPRVNPNSSKSGKPSDLLVVVMEPITNTLQIKPRVYRTIETRPINHAGLQNFSSWVENCNWADLYRCDDPNMEATMFQNILLEKYHECFPVRIMKISCDDKPWFSSELKDIDRRRKREFSKNYKSDLWRNLEEMFNEKCSIAKEKSHITIVSDLKESNPGNGTQS